MLTVWNHTDDEAIVDQVEKAIYLSFFYQYSSSSLSETYHTYLLHMQPITMSGLTGGGGVPCE